MTVLIPSTYLMNDIPRGTSPRDLLCSLAEHWRVDAGSQLCYELILQIMAREPIIRDSKLDDDLSVAIIEFRAEHTPMMFKYRDRDPNGFPMVSALGTLWRGVDLTIVDDNHRAEFTRAVMAGDLVYAETLAEFSETDVNAQDIGKRTALHWACANQLPDMTAFLLSMPGLDTSLRDADGLTAFDISCGHTPGPGDTTPATVNDNELIPTLFYDSMFEMDQTDPDGALFRMLTVTSEPDEGPLFPGEALFGPVVRNNLSLVEALMDTGVDLTETTSNQETALHLAAKHGHAEIVNALLSKSSRGEKFDVDAVARNDLTALHYAADRGHEQTVLQLVLHGADRGAEDDRGRTALDCATRNQHDATRKILEAQTRSAWGSVVAAEAEEIRAAPDIKTPSEPPVGTRPQPNQVIPFVSDHNDGNDTHNNRASGQAQDKGLHSAASDGDLAAVTKFLECGVRVKIYDKNADGLMALHFAASNGHTETVQFLLDQGADINEKLVRGSTALLFAAENGHTETVQLLLDQGTDSNGETVKGTTALLLAAQNGHTETVQLLLDRGADMKGEIVERFTALHLAAQNGYTEIVQLLLDQGADSNGETVNRWTALHMAAAKGHMEIVQLLLDQGADINEKSVKGSTALLFAAENGHTETVQLLLDQGADINEKSVKGTTAVKSAAQHGHTKTVQLLLDRGADINGKESKELTPLDFAAANGHTETVQLLLDRGADINGKESKKRTPLHLAAANGHTETAQLLLNQGADITAKNEFWATAEFNASSNGHKVTAKLLHDHLAKLGFWQRSRATNVRRTLLVQSPRSFTHFVRINLSDITWIFRNL